jgi:ATP/maltotriose-dependent transcriptional regulator MalT
MAWAQMYSAAVGTSEEWPDPEMMPLLLESIALFESVGDRWGASWPRGGVGEIYESLGRFQEAYEVYAARLEICREVGDAGGLAWTLQQIAKVALELNNPARARYFCRESLRVAVDVGSTRSTEEAIYRVALYFNRTGQPERAAELLSALADHPVTARHVQRWASAERDDLRGALNADRFEAASQRGRAWERDRLVRTLLAELADNPAPTEPQSLIEPLSEREREVLALVADGLSNREIAARLIVSLGTVKKHLNNIFGKLHVTSRTRAIQRARELHVI